MGIIALLSGLRGLLARSKCAVLAGSCTRLAGLGANECRFPSPVGRDPSCGFLNPAGFGPCCHGLRVFLPRSGAAEALLLLRESVAELVQLCLCREKLGPRRTGAVEGCVPFSRCALRLGACHSLCLGRCLRGRVRSPLFAASRISCLASLCGPGFRDGGRRDGGLRARIGLLRGLLRMPCSVQCGIPVLPGLFAGGGRRNGTFACGVPFLGRSKRQGALVLGRLQARFCAGGRFMRGGAGSVQRVLALGENLPEFVDDFSGFLGAGALSVGLFERSHRPRLGLGARLHRLVPGCASSVPLVCRCDLRLECSSCTLGGSLDFLLRRVRRGTRRGRCGACLSGLGITPGGVRPGLLEDLLGGGPLGFRGGQPFPRDLLGGASEVSGGPGLRRLAADPLGEHVRGIPLRPGFVCFLPGITSRIEGAVSFSDGRARPLERVIGPLPGTVGLARGMARILVRFVAFPLEDGMLGLECGQLVPICCGRLLGSVPRSLGPLRTLPSRLGLGAGVAGGLAGLVEHSASVLKPMLHGLELGARVCRFVECGLGLFTGLLGLGPCALREVLCSVCLHLGPVRCRPRLVEGLLQLADAPSQGRRLGGGRGGVGARAPGCAVLGRRRGRGVAVHGSSRDLGASRASIRDDTSGRISPGPILSVDPHAGVRDASRLGLIALVMTALAGVGDLAWGGMASPAFEELLNARAALLVACGHADALADLQYRAFCGGCSLDALLGAGPMRLIGPTVGAWKLVPLGLHGIASAALVFLAACQGGRRGGAVVLLLLLGAPAAWRELVLTGWGNHAESAAFTFGAAVLLQAVARRPWAALLGGGVAGLGLWYAWISAHALPALALAALVLGGGRALLAFGIGVLAGALPMLGFLILRPAALPETLDLWAGVEPAALGDWLRWWSEPFLPGRSWPHGDGLLRWLGSVAMVVLALLALLGIGLAGARRERSVGLGAVLAGLGLLGLGAATFLRHDLWAANATAMGFDPFALRYRAPALPLLVLGAGLAAGRSRVCAGLALLVVAFGIQQRIAGWVGGPGQDLGAPLDVAGLAFDPTVPEGAPPRRNPARMGRPQDVAAAEALLAVHTDVLPTCRAVHAGELGRRIGLREAGGDCAPWTVDGPDADAIRAGFVQGCRK